MVLPILHAECVRIGWRWRQFLYPTRDRWVSILRPVAVVRRHGFILEDALALKSSRWGGVMKMRSHRPVHRRVQSDWCNRSLSLPTLYPSRPVMNKHYLHLVCHWDIEATFLDPVLAHLSAISCWSTGQGDRSIDQPVGQRIAIGRWINVLGSRAESI